MKTEEEIRAEWKRAEVTETEGPFSHEAMAGVQDALAWVLGEDRGLEDTPSELILATGDARNELERMADAFKDFAPESEFWATVFE